MNTEITFDEARPTTLDYTMAKWMCLMSVGGIANGVSGQQLTKRIEAGAVAKASVAHLGVNQHASGAFVLIATLTAGFVATNMLVKFGRAKLLKPQGPA